MPSRRGSKELRDLERNAPQALDRLDAEAAALMKRLEGSSATRDRLAKYAQVNTQSVSGNFDAAKQKLDAVQAAIASGRKSIAAGKPAEAAVKSKEGERAAADASDAPRRGRSNGRRARFDGVQAG